MGLKGILSDVLVLDLSRVLAGPECSMILGDLGAEIIKVQEPQRGDDTRQWGPPDAGGESAYYLCANRIKKSIAISLKHKDRRATIRSLAAQADVVLENFLPGKAAAWAWDTRRSTNPTLT